MISFNMSSEKIIKYYLLCTIRSGSKKHIFDEVADTDLNTIITKKELSVYFKKHDNDTIVKESVVGGSDNNKKVLVVC